jgi:non-heme chloroperoxidase
MILLDRFGQCFRVMTMRQVTIIGLMLLLGAAASGQDTDTTRHKVQFVTVDSNIQLEVLDWGGSGRPVMLLAGLGYTAHNFDQFAPKLAADYHVYGITRRGFGKSSAPVPDGNAYGADRLGDDVLAVLAALKLNHPVLIGHSIAGEELSSVGSRHPESVSGLVYLDAGYGYACYDAAAGWLDIDVIDLQNKLDVLRPGKGPNDTRPAIRELMQTVLPHFEKDLETEFAWQDALPEAMHEGSSTSMRAASQAILVGEQKYSRIPVPILAIFAVPHDMGSAVNNDSVLRAKFDTQDEAWVGAQASAFAKSLPTARVVRLPHANHFVFQSNEADVLREIRAFVNGLP